MLKVGKAKPEHALDQDPARSYTLPARFYTDPDIFAAEREAIFYRGWHMACHANDLAEVGSYVTAAIFDQKVFICRGKDNVLRGFYNVCAHRAHELLAGSGKAKVITCPYHAWSYHLTGELRSARGSEDLPGFDHGEFCLTPVRVETYGHIVFFNLDDEAKAAADTFEGLDAELDAQIPGFATMQRRQTFSSTIEANWKVAVDNFVECYHCAPAHPAFADLVDLNTYHSTCHAQYSSHIGSGVRPDNKAYTFDPKAPVQKSAFWWLWPMSTVNLTPGDTAVSLFWFNPISPTRTELLAISYTPDGKSTPQLDAASEYAGTILSDEDNRLCESVQRGMASRGYKQGRFVVDAKRSAISEHAVHHFHQLVADALNWRKTGAKG
ncbi:MAG: Rieske 2Fe-2S domain-containing protein [Rhodospirillaceae bacterium]|nr:Rieske 2Fe-2S domain-containing protein [Rhodospirillaceae bacterium]